jgi:hypothetical protein
MAVDTTPVAATALCTCSSISNFAGIPSYSIALGGGLAALVACALGAGARGGPSNILLRIATLYKKSFLDRANKQKNGGIALNKKVNRVSF